VSLLREVKQINPKYKTNKLNEILSKKKVVEKEGARKNLQF